MLIFTAAACHAGPDGENPVVVAFAAASLRDVAVDLAAELERRQGIETVFNFAGSNTLALQIDAATGADVFLSADEKWVDALERSGRLVPGSRRSLMANRLVLIAHRDAVIDVAAPSDLIDADFRFLAIAEPDAVPAGRYARAHLERLTVAGDSLWLGLSGRIAPTLDVRAALALVESDPEVLGIVYQTDALTSARVRTVYTFPALEAAPITYWGALVEGGDAGEAGARFLDFLSGPEAAAIIERHGFLPIPR